MRGGWEGSRDRLTNCCLFVYRIFSDKSDGNCMCKVPYTTSSRGESRD